MCVELKKDYILEMSKSRSILGFAVPLQYFAKAQQLHSSRQGTSHILRKKIWGEGYTVFMTTKGKGDKN